MSVFRSIASKIRTGAVMIRSLWVMYRKRDELRETRNAFRESIQETEQLFDDAEACEVCTVEGEGIHRRITGPCEEHLETLQKYQRHRSGKHRERADGGRGGDT